MKSYEHKTETIYLRQRDNKWECIAKANDGRGIMLEKIPTKELAIRSMTFLLWGMNTFSPEIYGSEMAKHEGAPEGVEFPVVLEDPICSSS